MATLTLKSSVDENGNRRHEVHIDGKPRGYIDDHEFREYCARHIPAPSVPKEWVRASGAKLRLATLVSDFAAAHRIKDIDYALVRTVGELPEAAALYEVMCEEDRLHNHRGHRFASYAVES